MDKILTGWHDAGVVTLADAEKKLAEDRAEMASRAAEKSGETKVKKSGTKKEKPEVSFDIDDVFEKALARSFGAEEIKIREDN